MKPKLVQISVICRMFECLDDIFEVICVVRIILLCLVWVLVKFLLVRVLRMFMVWILEEELEKSKDGFRFSDEN